MYYNLINSMSRGAVALDADVINFLNANLITDTTYINALNTMVLGLKEDGLYDGIQCWHIFYGNGTQSKFNFKNPIDSNAGYRLIFGGLGFSAVDNNGFLGNGINNHASTFFTPSLVQNVNSNGMTIICRTNNTPIASDPVEIGNLIGLTQASLIIVKNGGNFGGRMNGEIFASPNSDAKGIYTVSRQSSTITKSAKNGVIINSINSGGTLPNQPILIMGLSINSGLYSNGFSNQQLTQSMMHIGFSDAQIALLHSRLDAFENALGRKTW